MKKSTKLGIGSGALLLIGIIGFLALKKPHQGMTDVVSRGDVVEAAYGVGAVKSDKTYTIKTGVSSRVVKRYVRQGQRVKKGDILIQLDGLPTYYAPFNGVVTTLSYDVGEVVFSQTVVLTIVSLEDLYMQLSMDERTIGGVREGQEARISFEGQRDKTSLGKVRAVYSNDSGFLIDVDFDRKNLTLLPNMTADVAIQIAVHKDKLRVPVASLDIDKVTKVTDKPVEVHVKVGANDGRYAVVETDQLKEGDRILLRKTAGNSHGDPF